MPAWTANDHFETPAAKGFRNNRVRARTVEYKAVGDRILPTRRGKNMTHAAKIAFTFFPDISDEDKRQRMPDPDRAQQRCNRKHRHDSGTVVGNARSINAASLLPDVQRSICRK